MVIKFSPKIRKTHLHFPDFLFLLGLFLKQFYTRQSGSIQISDAVMMTAVVFLVVSRRRAFFNIDLPLAVFVVFTFVINGIYTLYYRENFMMSSVYLLYNLLAVIAFRVFIQEEDFVKALTFTLKLNLLTQVLIYLSGYGRLHSSVRYEGTFNDPNQFGFFVLCCFFMLYLCYFLKERHFPLVWYLVAGFLVLISASRGMMLAFLIFLFFAVIQPYLAGKDPITQYVCYILLAFAAAFYLWGGAKLLSVFRGLNNERIDFLISRFERSDSGSSSLSGKILNFLHDRQMLRIIYAPFYFLFGSGEGYSQRFWAYGGQGGEIHGTMIALWYYYGIIPYLFFLKWIWNNLKGLPSRAWGVFIAVILEACTLANHRQPLFWTMFVMGSMIAEKARQEKMNTVYGNYVQRNRSGVPGERLS